MLSQLCVSVEGKKAASADRYPHFILNSTNNYGTNAVTRERKSLANLLNWFQKANNAVQVYHNLKLPEQEQRIMKREMAKVLGSLDSLLQFIQSKLE